MAGTMDAGELQPLAAGALSTGRSSARVIGLVMALFFAFGFCTVLVDSIIPKLKATFALSYAEVMLTQLCFFGAYFLVSLPAAWLHSRIGYLKGVAVGLLLIMVSDLVNKKAGIKLPKKPIMRRPGRYFFSSIR